MDTFIIGCKTLKNELNAAYEACGCSYDIFWIESGLHNVPKLLTEALQETLDKATGYERALFAMGYCGNSLTGLSSNNLSLVIPRVDDCISLLFGSYQTRLEIGKRDHAYFMTEGWLRGERTIWHEYEYALEKYGQEAAQDIMGMMLGNYRSLDMLDTGCYNLAGIEPEVKSISDALGLEYRVVPATIDYIIRLLTGPWDEESFLMVPPHTTIGEKDLKLSPLEES